MKFHYAINTETDEPVMLISQHIGMDSEDGMGVDGSLFQKELFALDSMNKKRIVIYINSVGGVVMDGYSICNAILKTKTRVDTYCAGMAASIAGIIFQTGRKRIMADYGVLMYHNPYDGADKESPVIQKMKDSLNTIVSQKSGMDSSSVQRMFDKETFLSASDAFDLGLCDEVDCSVSLNTKNFPRVAASSDSKVLWNAASKVLNKVIETNSNRNHMKSVTNKLGLNEDANESSILSAIAKVENRAEVAEQALAAKNKASDEEMKAKAAELKEAEDKFNALKAQYDAATAELETEKKAKADAEDKVATEQAKVIVNDAVKIGKIANDAKVIAEWVADAKENPEKIKNRIAAIPLNKKAAAIPISNENKGEEALSGSLIAAAQAKLIMKR